MSRMACSLRSLDLRGRLRLYLNGSNAPGAVPTCGRGLPKVVWSLSLLLVREEGFELSASLTCYLRFAFSIWSTAPRAVTTCGRGLPKVVWSLSLLLVREEGFEPPTASV